MDNCNCCGASRANVSIGGALLCSTCAEDVRVEMDRLRAEGKPVNALGIARRIWREKYCLASYTLRNVPIELWRRVKQRALDNDTSARDVILTALEEYLGGSGR